MAKLIYVDASGNVLKKTEKTRGRPPRGSEKQANGDFIVRPVQNNKLVVEYITLDNADNVIKRETKTRGRTRPNYTKMDDGPFAGHWVGKVAPTTVVATTNTNATTTVA